MPAHTIYYNNLSFMSVSTRVQVFLLFFFISIVKNNFHCPKIQMVSNLLSLIIDSYITKTIKAFRKSSSSSCRVASTDIPDPLSPLLPIVHRLRQVFRATSRILTQLLNVCSSWSSCFCLAICGGPQEYITYELVYASPAVSACLVRLTWIVFVMGGRWPYSCCLEGCCRQDLFNIGHSWVDLVLKL